MGDIVCVYFVDLVCVLEFLIEVDVEWGIVLGWFIDEGSKFFLNMVFGRVWVGWKFYFIKFN